MTKISCIIPAYNEGKRIRNVLEVVAVHPLIDEVIVIDDGSIDETKKVALEFKKVKLIVHERNLGKSASLYDGIKESSGNYLFFIDADLTYLNAQNITDMIAPVTSGMADVSLSLRKNTPIQWHILGIDYITGERVLSRDIILPHLNKILSLKPFAFEVFLNDLIIKNKCRLKIVPWSNVYTSSKVKKIGLWKGLKGDFFMCIEIIKTVSIFGLFYQIIKMRNLRVK